MDIVSLKNTLIEDGILPNMKGYVYCVNVIMLVVDYGCSVSSAYEYVAKMVGVRANSIEKSISNCIEKAFLKQETQKKYSEFCLKSGKVSNKKYINMIIKQILSENIY